MNQGTEEWVNARLGRVTASRISDVMAKTKSGYGASRTNYMATLITERLTGAQAPQFETKEMIWGRETEAAAKAAYCFMTDAAVEDVGFIDHPAISMTGASPDGLIGADGLIEAKCPNTSTHIDTLLSENIDGKYILQMQFQLAVTGRKWCDFVSFDPRLPAEMQLWIKRVYRDDAKIAEIEKEVRAFLGELNAKVSALQARYMRAAA